MSRDKLNNLRKQLRKQFLERETVIDGVLATMLHGSNAVLFGPPGTAKSDLIHSICKSIEGANYFNRLLFKTMPPEDLLGPPSLKELSENDRLIRNTSGRLPEAHVAFLDEIFKCSPTTLNSLLRIANEREFDNPDPKPIPLIFMVGASNEVPTEPEMKAFLDRFIYKPWVRPLRRAASKKSLLARVQKPTAKKNTVKMTMKDLEELKNESQKIEFSDKLVRDLLSFHSGLEKSSLYISDRKLVAIVGYLKAFAYIQGDKQVTTEHMHEILPDCCSNTTEEAAEVRKVLKEKCPCLLQRAQEWFSIAKECSTKVSETADDYSMTPSQYNEELLERAISQESRNLSSLERQLEQAIAEDGQISEKVNTILKGIAALKLEVASYREQIV